MQQGSHLKELEAKQIFIAVAALVMEVVMLVMVVSGGGGDWLVSWQ